jgi:hypothetical protein
MTIELTIPESWTPGQALAIRALLQQVIDSGHPVVGCVRPDVTPVQFADISRQVRELIRGAGLAA